MEIISQTLSCPKCSFNGPMTFEKKGESNTQCPECGFEFNLLYYCPLGSCEGRWIPLLQMSDPRRFEEKYKNFKESYKVADANS